MGWQQANCQASCVWKPVNIANPFASSTRTDIVTLKRLPTPTMVPIIISNHTISTDNCTCFSQWLWDCFIVCTHPMHPSTFLEISVLGITVKFWSTCVVHSLACTFHSCWPRCGDIFTTPTRGSKCVSHSQPWSTTSYWFTSFWRLPSLFWSI